MEPAADVAQPLDAMARFRRWAAIAVAVAALGYLAYALFVGLGETAGQLAAFWWPWYVPVLALTLVNYGLRYAKWALLLKVLGVEIPQRANLWIYLAGLAMVISPGKAGELVKPYLVNVVTGAPMMRTVPALVVERGTDGLAVVILAAIGVSTYSSENTNLIFGTLALTGLGVAALSIRPLVLGVLRRLEGLPVVGRWASRLEEMYEATYLCLRPAPLAATMGMSLVAWFAECVGYWLVFRGLNVAATLDVSTFLYAFATVFGAPTPGGLGFADAALAEGAMGLVDGIAKPQALAAAILVRIATLWFGVALGAVALLRMEQVIAQSRSGAELAPPVAPPASRSS
jgi:glycosyltransferase 2 family protein